MTNITAKSKLHGVELGDELAIAMSQAIAEEIDWEIMCDLLSQAGWQKVKAPTDGNPLVTDWVQENVKGRYKNRFDIWIFERSEDAVWFTLRWSS
jgi:hypothetical protein